MAFPASKKTFPRAATLRQYSSLGAAGIAQLFEDIGVTLEGLQDRAGEDDTVDETALLYRLARAEAAIPVNVEKYGVKPGAGNGALNSFAVAAILGSTFAGLPVDLIFPSRWGSYEFSSISIGKSDRLIGLGQDWTELKCTGTGGLANPFITIAGTDTADFSGRLSYCGVHRMRLTNATAQDTIGLNVLHGTHHHFADIDFVGWRRHALYASNLSDSWLDRLEFEYCGSADDSNLAAVRFDSAASIYWAGDANKWNACRWEVCGDRQLDLLEGAGGQPNKHVFTACKWENSGSGSDGLGGTGPQINLVNGTHIVFQGCDFTLQDKRAAHALLPSAIGITGSAPAVYMSDCQFSFGSGSRPKVFTSFVDVTGANATLVMSNVTGNCGNTTAFPTQFVKATSTPTVGLKNVGWIGANRASGTTVLSGAVASLAF